ncbi:MAG: DUF4360 domain-containing protein, partial [Oligoflexia bacterium]|nr:DUF4360 domain-containing protein [Oligoflexia bacterium]
LVLFITSVASISLLLASDEIILNAPSYGGNGCPRGTFSATLSPDKSSLSLIFDKYVAQAGGSSGIKSDNKTCNILIPITISAGYSMAIVRSDYRGFIAIPSGANANIKTDYFFHGYPGFHDEKSWDGVDGVNNDDYFFSREISENKRQWSHCGKKVNLHVNTNLKVRTNTNNQDVYASLDTIDIASARGGVIYKLLFKKCQ